MVVQLAVHMGHTVVDVVDKVDLVLDTVDLDLVAFDSVMEDNQERSRK